MFKQPVLLLYDYYVVQESLILIHPANVIWYEMWILVN